MENYSGEQENQSEPNHWKEKYAKMGPREHEMLHHWKKMIWHKMQLAKLKADALMGDGIDEDTKKKVYKGLGIAALVGLGLGVLIGKSSKRG